MSAGYQGPKPGETHMPAAKVPVPEPVHSTLSLFNPPKTKAVLVRMVNKISTKKKPMRRVMVIFMNRILLCRESGEVSRAVHASEVAELCYCKEGGSYRFMLNFKDRTELSIVWEPIAHIANPVGESPWRICEAINDVRGRFRNDPLPIKPFDSKDSMWFKGNYDKRTYVTPKAKLENPSYTKDPNPTPINPPPVPIFKAPPTLIGTPLPIEVTIERSSASQGFGIDLKGMLVNGSTAGSPAETAGVDKYKGLSLLEVENTPVNFVNDLPPLVQGKTTARFKLGLRDHITVTRTNKEPLGITYSYTPEAGLKLTGVERNSPTSRCGGEGFVNCFITHVDGVEVKDEKDLGKECSGKTKLTLRLTDANVKDRAASAPVKEVALPPAKPESVPRPVVPVSQSVLPAVERLDDGSILLDINRTAVTEPIGLDMKSLRIMGVEEGSPASRSGLPSSEFIGKSIVEANGVKVATHTDLNNVVTNLKSFKLKLKVVPLPAASSLAEDDPLRYSMLNPEPPSPLPPPKGVNDENTLYITKGEMEDLGIVLDHFKIVGFEPGSAAERCGARVYLGRKVTHVGDMPIYTVREFAELTRNRGEICIRFQEAGSEQHSVADKVSKTSKNNATDEPPPPPSAPPSTIDGGYVDSVDRGYVDSIADGGGVGRLQRTEQEEEPPVEVYDSGTGGAYGTILHAVAQLVDRQARTEDLLCTLLGSLREQQAAQLQYYQHGSHHSTTGPPLYIENRPSSPVFVRDLPITDLTKDEPAPTPTLEPAANTAVLYEGGSARRRRLPPSSEGGNSSSPQATLVRSLPKAGAGGASPTYRRVEIDLTAGKVLLT